MAKKTEETITLKKINLTQARQILKYLDNIGYVDLATHKELDDLVFTMIESETYRGVKQEIEARAQKILDEYNKIDLEITKQISELNAKFEWASKKEAKKLRQDIWILEQKKKDEFNKSKEEFNSFQEQKMDVEGRWIIIAEVSPNLYEVLERKFYIKDFEGEAKPVEVVDTDKLATDIL